jgi:2-polyprenyl-6-methoxyphenol hydroxylase-like FAD-dependent oxidoreductase
MGQIDDWEQVLTARYGDVRMGKWHRDRLVFLGDAGHAMSPQLGQGVNLALADASCLAACLAELPLEKALPEYSRRRGPSLRYYQFATRWLTPVFQSDYEFISPFRYYGFRTSQRIPFVRKMMTKSMAGMMRAI